MSPSRDLSSRTDIGDDNGELELPKRKYGYATKPFTWPELVEIIDGNEPNLARLSRSVEQQRDYMLYTRNMLEEYKSVYDHILVSKFGFDKRLVENRWEAYPELSQVSQVKTALCMNDFPYYNADGIEHWCLWKLCQDIKDEELDDAKEELRRKYGTDIEFLCWRNPPHLKSLPDIDHYHILVRRGDLVN